MKKVLLALAFGGLMSSAAIADEVELAKTVPQKDKDRRVVIEMIEVTSEKEVVEIEETDAAVNSILEELDALEEDDTASDDTEGTS